MGVIIHSFICLTLNAIVKLNCDSGKIDSRATGFSYKISQKPCFLGSVLAVHSFLAGLFLGINNFLLGLISELGINGAFIFSLGALIFTITYKLLSALRNKKQYGRYWLVEESNLLRLASNNIEINWINVFGLILRTAINICI